MTLPRSMFVACSIVASLACAAASARQVPPPGLPPQPAGAQAYAFPSGAGILFFYVRPERTDDFERVVKQLSEVLTKAEDPIRKQQAAGWRMFKSIETTKDTVIYVFFVDPAVPGTDYDPIKVLSEALPAEAHGLYESLKGATVRVERMGLGKIR